jgi:hypothetical protein
VDRGEHNVRRYRPLSVYAAPNESRIQQLKRDVETALGRKVPKSVWSLLHAQGRLDEALLRPTGVEDVVDDLKALFAMQEQQSPQARSPKRHRYAISRAAARSAVSEPAVQKFWAENPPQRVSSETAGLVVLDWCRRREPEGLDIIADPTSWNPPPGDDPFRYGRLEGLCRQLSRDYPWSMLQAAEFVLTNRVPKIDPVRVIYKAIAGTTEEMITLVVSPDADPTHAASALNWARRQHLPDPKDPHVLYVFDQRQRLLYPGVTGEQRKDAWNREHPERPFVERSNYVTAVKKAARSIGRDLMTDAELEAKRPRVLP